MISECKIIKTLATGGQKTVYLGEHPEIGSIVIKKGPLNSFSAIERIKREIDLLKSIDSPFYPKQFHFNIDVVLNDFTIIEKFIEGLTLREKMSSYHTVQKIFPLLISLTEGLSVIWEKNVVHRDLKPENIIIRKDGTICIIDLGIARFLDMDSITNSIFPMGPCTTVYAAPEQLSNSKNLIDHRTDFFALGIIGLELYLQGHPFDLNNGYSIVENILNNNYRTFTESVSSDQRIIDFANKTLRTQLYERFRTYKDFQNFLKK